VEAEEERASCGDEEEVDEVPRQVFRGVLELRDQTHVGIASAVVGLVVCLLLLRMCLKCFDVQVGRRPVWEV